MSSIPSISAYGAATEEQLGLINGAIFRGFQASNDTKNWVLNSNMYISQRGDFATADTASASGYYVDRFVCSSGVVSCKMRHVTTNQPTTTPSKSLKVTATSAGTGHLLIAQGIENPVNLWGRIITLSAWVKSNSPYARLRIYSGTGSISGAFTGTAHTGDGTWQLLSVSFTVPIAETTTSNISCQCITYSDAGAPVALVVDKYIETTLWVLNEGSVRAPYSLQGQSIVGELPLCQRYFTPIMADTIFAGITAAATIVDFGVSLPTALRVAPTVYYPAAITWRVYLSASAQIIAGAPTVPYGYMLNGGTITLRVSGFTGLTADRNASLTRASGGLFIGLDAEL